VKRLIIREAAADDARTITAYYREIAGGMVAEEWAQELERSLNLLLKQPGIGAPRLGQELDLDNFRALKTRKFPYLVGYTDHEDHIEVWRIVHERRNWDAWQGES
jgi:toxin ParE1/3/4